MPKWNSEELSVVLRKKKDISITTVLVYTGSSYMSLHKLSFSTQILCFLK